MSSEVTQSNTFDSAVDKHDHEIRLVDTTAEGSEDVTRFTTSGSWRGLVRNATHTSIRDQISRRKYASWRKDKFENDDERGSENVERRVERSQVATGSHPENEESQTVDFGTRLDTGDAGKKDTRRKHHKEHSEPKPETEVDILYENQRGSFFCGIPLYSHSSLLNFDPAAWVTRDFKNSPVNITNAQVPDPSWTWAWKTWYVDMSHDVDEEGWQYSFSFGKKFAWHGTHPWIHSFVRRRRWLRKRVKRTDSAVGKDKEGSLEAAHHLNTDYFTIHSKQRDRSPSSAINPDAQLARPVSYSSFQSVEEEFKKPDEINNLPSLTKAIRVAKIDREKIDAIKQFVTNGGAELHYLADQIPEIMSALVFQNSRRQILAYLKNQAEEAQHHRYEHDAEDRPEGEEEKRRIDNLLHAAEVADTEISGLEYWSDRKHVLRTEDEGKEHDDEGQMQQRKDVLGEIKGISEKAETSAEIRVDRRLQSKGKEAAERESVPYEDEKKQQLTLGHDDVLLPEEDSNQFTVDEDL